MILHSEHAQSDVESVNRGLPVLDQARGPQRSKECACLSHARAIEHVNDDNKTRFEREAKGNPEMDH